jgi:hypothetical protein
MQSEDNLVSQGDEADALLKNETFNSVINNLVEDTFSQFCNSKAGEPSEREQTYFHYRALVGIVHTLQERVAVRDGIMSKRESELSDNNGE